MENLKGTDHQFYWFDILGSGNLSAKLNLTQFVNWKKRKIPYIKGEYFLMRKVPFLYSKLQPYLEITANEELDRIIQEVQPDIVHSFEMQSCSYPILGTMKKYRDIKWIYSCWGSDLFYYKNFRRHNVMISQVLQRINYIHTDCFRDYYIAKQLGFSGKHLGVIPGGGGYDMSFFKKYSEPFINRNYIVVKGYHHKFGRALQLIKALHTIKKELNDFKVVIFGAHKIVVDYVAENNLSFLVHPKETISHDEILKFMGKGLIYLGNSVSDGMPNTLLEAMFMGAFPIQSNPGNATAEIIIDGENGFLIEDPYDEKTISRLILKAIENPEILQNAFTINQQLAKERLEYSVNQQKIVALYRQIENE
jgi:glycosyltransferase involved in cell wall biosynthesis